MVITMSNFMSASRLFSELLQILHNMDCIKNFRFQTDLRILFNAEGVINNLNLFGMAKVLGCK